MTPANQARAFVYVFAGVFLVGGLMAWGAGVWNLTWAFRSAHWPTTEGVIQTAKMKREVSNGPHRHMTHSAEISYAYEVAGTNYTGTQVAFGEMSASVDYARGILDRFPVGRKVPVYYFPKDPQTAVLETGVHGGTWICFGVGTGFELVGWLMVALGSAIARAGKNADPITTSQTTVSD
jgi:hypothetical protein